VRLVDVVMGREIDLFRLAVVAMRGDERFPAEQIVSLALTRRSR